MQILKAGGVQTIGKDFSSIWKDTIYSANKRGFYESLFRRGIYYRTNPSPHSGAWIPPDTSQHLGVKVFVPGVLRSDVAYLHRVIATVRPYRKYVGSIRRLFELERQGLIEQGKPARVEATLDPVLEWWLENFLLIRDISLRAYPARLISYESTLHDPQSVCAQIFDWLELGDDEAAARAVHPEDQTQTSITESNISHRHEEVFDEYHHRIKTGSGFERTFLSKMNDVHRELLPEIEDGLDRIAAERRKQRSERNLEPEEKQRSTHALNVDRIDALLHGIAELGD